MIVLRKCKVAESNSILAFDKIHLIIKITKNYSLALSVRREITKIFAIYPCEILRCNFLGATHTNERNIKAYVNNGIVK